MPTESTMANLQLDRAVLKRQIDELSGHMQETKIQRQALEKEHKEAQLHLHAIISQGDAEGVKVATAQVAAIEQELLAVEERLQSANQRLMGLQREHGMAIGALNRCEAEALNVGERVKRLRHDLFLMTRKQDHDSPLVVNAIRSIRADLEASQQKYIGLVGEVLPDEAA